MGWLRRAGYGWGVVAWVKVNEAPQKTRAEARVFVDTARAVSKPYSAASALLKVLLGRIAAEALATSGR